MKRFRDMDPGTFFRMPFFGICQKGYAESRAWSLVFNCWERVNLYKRYPIVQLDLK